MTVFGKVGGFVAALTLVSALWAAEVKKDIPYYEEGYPRTGNEEYLNERCKLDLQLPSGVKDFPTVVWYHGGGMTGGRKWCPALFDAKKLAVVGVEYRFSGEKAKCPDYIYDAAAAAAWVLKNIARFGGDPKKVYLCGHSAGGYLCAMLALDKRYLEAFGVSPMQLAGVIPLSGQMTTHYQIQQERGAKEPRKAITVDEYAPLFWAGGECPPLLLIVGDPKIEWPSRVEENELLYARLRRIFNRKEVWFHTLSGFNHGTMVSPALLLANEWILSRSK